MTHPNRLTFAGIAIFAAILISSCAGIKPGSTQSAKNLYTTFFVGDEGLQYFIKPLEFKNENGEEFIMDVTFRYKEEVTGDADFRFTYIGQSMIKKVSQLQFENKTGAWTAEEVELVFVELVNKSYQSRQSAKLSLSDTQALFSSPEWVIKMTAEGGEMHEFRPKRKTQKAINRLYSHIFEML